MPLPPSRTSVVCKRDNGHAGSKLFVLLHNSMLNKNQLPYKPYYSTVFSICLDLYLHILERVRNKVLEVLQHDRPLWHVKNTCPACSYRLHDEKNLTLKTLVTMDGNHSLKQLRRTGRGAKDEADGPTWMTNSPPAFGESLMRQGFSWRYVAMGLFCW